MPESKMSVNSYRTTTLNPQVFLLPSEMQLWAYAEDGFPDNPNGIKIEYGNREAITKSNICDYIFTSPRFEGIKYPSGLPNEEKEDLIDFELVKQK